MSLACAPNAGHSLLGGRKDQAAHLSRPRKRGGVGLVVEPGYRKNSGSHSECLEESGFGRGKFRVMGYNLQPCPASAHRNVTVARRLGLSRLRIRLVGGGNGEAPLFHTLPTTWRARLGLLLGLTCSWLEQPGKRHRGRRRRAAADRSSECEADEMGANHSSLLDRSASRPAVALIFHHRSTSHRNHLAIPSS